MSISDIAYSRYRRNYKTSRFIFDERLVDLKVILEIALELN